MLLVFNIITEWIQAEFEFEFEQSSEHKQYFFLLLER